MNRLTLLTWPDYIDPRTLTGFEGEFHVEIHVEIVPGAVDLIARMNSGGDLPDLLVPPDYAVRELSAADRLLELDPSQLPNLKNLEARFRQGRSHDPQGRVSVVKDWGTTGFLYRSDLIPERPASWKDFWTLAAKYSGRVTVLDSPGEVIGAALKLRGYSYNASSADHLAAAREALLQLKPHLLAFETNYRPLLAAGEAWLSLGWNGDAAALQSQGIPIQYVVPLEGSQIWEDDWAASAATSHPELAHAFLNFVLRPEIALQEARYTRYATGNHEAYLLLDEKIRQDPSTYPAREVVEKLEAGMPLDDEGQKRRDALWSEIRS